MEIWGITGLGGTGKTTATDWLRQQGFPTLDVDAVGKIVFDRNTDLGKEGFAAIYRVFGDTVLDRTRALDRSALRKRILLNPHEKTKLEEIVDPLVQKHVTKVVDNEWPKGKEFGFIEGSRLAEAGYHNIIKGLICISADFDKRITRVSKRDSFGKEETEAMFRLQDNDALMRRAAKVQLKNDGSKKALETALENFIAERRKARG